MSTTADAQKRAEETLEGIYPSAKNMVVLIDNQIQAVSYLNSKASCCWGNGKIRGTDYYLLSQPSKRAEQKKRTVFVCEASLVELKEPYHFARVKYSYKLLGTDLQFKTDELIICSPATNLPRGGWFCFPADGRWGNEAEYDWEGPSMHLDDDNIILLKTNWRE